MKEIRCKYIILSQDFVKCFVIIVLELDDCIEPEEEEGMSDNEEDFLDALLSGELEDA